MFLHLGSDVVVKNSEVLAVLDLETTSISKITKSFLAEAQKNGRVIDVSIEDLPKSYVLCATKEDFKVYVSPISTKTLLKRSRENSFNLY